MYPPGFGVDLMGGRKRETGGLSPAFPGTSCGLGSVPKIIQKYPDDIWALGGEIIRDLNENPP
jgi:hypothetical protein